MQVLPFHFEMTITEKIGNIFEPIGSLIVIGNARLGAEFYPDIVSLNVLKHSGYIGCILPSMLPSNSELFAAIENHCEYLKDNMPTASEQIINEEMDSQVNDMFKYLGDMFKPQGLAT